MNFILGSFTIPKINCQDYQSTRIFSNPSCVMVILVFGCYSDLDAVVYLI